jgi:hypothetical protein
VALAASARGFEIRLDEKKGRIVLEGQGGELELRMSEKTEQRSRRVKRYDGKMEDEQCRVPTGRLRLYVERGYGKVWTCEETAEAPLERKLNVFFVGVWKQVAFCRVKAREEEERARREAVISAERAEVARAEREAAALREAERKRREGLLEEVTAWRRANEIRAYVEAVRAEIEKCRAKASAESCAWVEWAPGVAGEMDPVGLRERTGVGASPRGHVVNPIPGDSHSAVPAS